MNSASVTVQREPADFRQLSRFVGRQQKTWRLYLLATFLFGFVFFLEHGSPGHGELSLLEELLSWVVSLAPVLIFVVVLTSAYWWWSTSRRAILRLNPGAFVPTTYTVLNEGFYSQSERSETLNFWNTILHFHETPNYFFLLLGRRSGHVVPKRCFPTPEAAADFGNQIRLQLERHASTALTTVSKK